MSGIYENKMNFNINKSQKQLIDTWIKEQDLIAVETQKSVTKFPTMWHKLSWDDGNNNSYINLEPI